MKRFLGATRLRIAGAVLLAGVAVAVAAGDARADPAPGGCPTGDGWFFQPLADHDPALDVGNFHDQNGDEFVCVRINRGHSKKAPPTAWTVKDNTNPLQSE